MWWSRQVALSVPNPMHLEPMRLDPGQWEPMHPDLLSPHLLSPVECQAVRSLVWPSREAVQGLAGKSPAYLKSFSPIRWFRHTGEGRVGLAGSGLWRPSRC